MERRLYDKYRYAWMDCVLGGDGPFLAAVGEFARMAAEGPKAHPDEECLACGVGGAFPKWLERHGFRAEPPIGVACEQLEDGVLWHPGNVADDHPDVHPLLLLEIGNPRLAWLAENMAMSTLFALVDIYAGARIVHLDEGKNFFGFYPWLFTNKYGNLPPDFMDVPELPDLPEFAGFPADFPGVRTKPGPKVDWPMPKGTKELDKTFTPFPKGWSW